jgi:hypothetical protein
VQREMARKVREPKPTSRTSKISKEFSDHDTTNPPYLPTNCWAVSHNAEADWSVFPSSTASSHAANPAPHRLIVETKEENSFRACVVPIIEKCCISRVRCKVSQSRVFLCKVCQFVQLPVSRMIHDVMAPTTSSLCHRRIYKFVAFSLFAVH